VRGRVEAAVVALLVLAGCAAVGHLSPTATTASAPSTAAPANTPATLDPASQALVNGLTNNSASTTPTTLPACDYGGNPLLAQMDTPTNAWPCVQQDGTIWGGWSVSPPPTNVPPCIVVPSSPGCAPGRLFPSG
jgi:hypothetical protein